MASLFNLRHKLAIVLGLLTLLAIGLFALLVRTLTGAAPPPDLEPLSHRSFLYGVLLVAAFVVLALTYGVRFTRSFRQRMEALAQGLKRLEKNDFSKSLVLSGDDELAALSRAFNGMAESLRTTREKELLVTAADARIRALEEARGELEAQVEQRTRELSLANAELKDNLQQLKETRAKLLTSERLASIGTLAAGVAHEVNNPIAYVSSNLRFLKEELPELLEAVRQGAQDVPERAADVESALAEAVEGAQRVAAIVQDLKTLSRGDSDLLETVDVRRVLDSALNVAHNQVKHKASVVKDYGSVPLVMGSGARLGQVFLNLIVNAAQAMPEEKHGSNMLVLGTRTDESGRVVVEVKDTGCGIPLEIRERIFDPFFTTKPPGVGTGLGLFVCHGIISNLKGTLEVESEPGLGSTFRVVLPAVPET